MQNNLISVIAPVYNVQAYLSECIESILSQSYVDFEVLLIDDGSSDNSSKICDEYAKKDSRIKVFHNKNRGYGFSCNFGLERAVGKYVCIIETDDFIDTNMFADLCSVADKSDADIVKSAFWEYVDLPRIRKNKYRAVSINKNELDTFVAIENPMFFAFHPSIWSCLYKRDFLLNNNIKFSDTGVRGWEDNLFQVKTFCLAKKISYTPKAYYHWRKNYRFDYEKISNPCLPMIRTVEIHRWLQENNVNSSDISACLFRRDMVCIKLSLQASRFSDLKDLRPLFAEYISLLDYGTLSKSKHCRSSFRYFGVKNFFTLFYMMIKLKIFLKKRATRVFPI